MVLCYQHQNVVDIDLDLFDQFHFKDDIILDIVFVHLYSVLIIEVVVDTCVILKINRNEDSIPGKIIEC